MTKEIEAILQDFFYNATETKLDHLLCRPVCMGFRYVRITRFTTFKKHIKEGHTAVSF